MLELIEKVDVHAIAHLTGGGFWENIPRVLPDNTQAVIDESSWQWPEEMCIRDRFNWLARIITPVLQSWLNDEEQQVALRLLEKDRDHPRVLVDITNACLLYTSRCV